MWVEYFWHPENFFINVLIFKLDAHGDYKMNVLLGLVNIKGEGKFKLGIGKFLK